MVSFYLPWHLPNIILSVFHLEHCSLTLVCLKRTLVCLRIPLLFRFARQRTPQGFSLSPEHVSEIEIQSEAEPLL